MMNEMKCSRKEFVGANITDVFISTNCPCGGDSGYGGKTVFTIRDLGGTDLRAFVKGVGEKPYKCENAEEVQIVLGGDSEAYMFVEALEFALKELRKQLRSNQ